MGQCRELLDGAYARILGVEPDADCLELAQVAVRLGCFRVPDHEETVRLLARCIRVLEQFSQRSNPPNRAPLENLTVGVLSGPEVLGGMRLDALIACAVDLGLVDRGQAATAGYVDPKFGPTVLALDDALDHLACEVGYLIEGV